jgi:hypothetical protein
MRLRGSMKIVSDEKQTFAVRLGYAALRIDEDRL